MKQNLIDILKNPNDKALNIEDVNHLLEIIHT